MKVNLRLVAPLMLALVAASVASCVTLYSNDYGNYIDIFEYSYHSDYSRIEPFFLLLSRLFFSLGFSFEAFWFFISFVSFFIKFLLIERTKCSVLLLIFLSVLYAFSLGILHEVTQIRASLAIAFGSLFIYFFNGKGKLAVSLIFLFSAAMFHYSAVLFAFCLFFGRGFKRLSPRGCFFVAMLFLLLPMLADVTVDFISGINPLFKYYLENSEKVETGGLFSMTTMLAVVYLLFMVLFLFLFPSHQYIRACIGSYIVGVIFLVAFTFSPVISVRVYELFSFVGFLVLALLYSKHVNILVAIERKKFLFKCMRLFVLIMLTLISAHRFIAFIYVNPILQKY